MSSASTANAAAAAAAKHDPEAYRMTIGEHLEELRKRMFLGVVGFVVAFIVSMIYGHEVLYFLCKPLFIALARNGYSTHVHILEASESFMTYIKASMICAGTAAGPWIIYQLWLFVAAGLYPQERKYVTKYLPLSIVLFVTGVVFLYIYVLPLMLEFFIGFQIGGLPPLGADLGVKPNAATQPSMLAILPKDPTDPLPGQLWIDSVTGMLKICIAPGTVRVLDFGSSNAITPMITLASYFDMVIGMLLAFGLAFQLPLVVLALVRIGIMQIATLRSARRIVYFSLSIIAAVIVPDVVTGMIALLLPLILLYEFGILLAVWSEKKANAEPA
jgi:Sec-independent protein secretion pathway component TatC